MKHVKHTSDPDYLRHTGERIAEVTKYSLNVLGSGPVRSLILPGIRLTEHRTWEERLKRDYVPTILPDEADPFSLGFKEVFGIENYAEFTQSLPVYFAGLSVEFQPIAKSEDYLPEETTGMNGPVPVPAVRVAFVPNDINPFAVV